MVCHQVKSEQNHRNLLKTVLQFPRQKTHSVAQAKTKLCIRTDVAPGLNREMTNQIPTPVIEPLRSRRIDKSGGLDLAIQAERRGDDI